MTTEREALEQIIALVEKSEPRPIHPATGELLGRRPNAQKIIDIAQAALDANNIAAAVQAEREACAKECFSAQIHKASYNLSGDTGRGYNFAMRDIAAAIRARKDVTK